MNLNISSSTDDIVDDEEHFYISLPLFVVYTMLSLLGVLFAIICLVFNLWFRKQKYVIITRGGSRNFEYWFPISKWKSIFFTNICKVIEVLNTSESAEEAILGDFVINQYYL